MLINIMLLKGILSGLKTWHLYPISDTSAWRVNQKHLVPKHSQLWSVTRESSYK